MPPDHGHADGHHGGEARIFGKLREILRVEEFIFFRKGRRPFTGLVSEENSLARAVGLAFKERHSHSAAEGGQEYSQRQNNQQ